MGQMTILPPNAVTLKDGHTATDSLTVAEVFGRKHKNVLDAVKRLDCSMEFAQLNFQPGSYLDANNQPRPMYVMTKDGFMFLVMGFTGAEAAKRKEAYIKRFNEMEAALHQPAPVEETIPVKAAEYWRMRAELAEMKLDNRSRKNFTEAEKATMKALKAQGLGNTEIGRKIGRSADSVGSFFYQEKK